MPCICLDLPEYMHHAECPAAPVHPAAFLDCAVDPKSGELTVFMRLLASEGEDEFELPDDLGKAMDEYFRSAPRTPSFDRTRILPIPPHPVEPPRRHPLVWVLAGALAGIAAGIVLHLRRR